MRKTFVVAVLSMIVLLVGMLSAISAANPQQPTVSQETKGTSSATGQPTASPPPTGKALVYVYREGKMVGAAGYNRIFINNDYLAALRNSNYAQREVPPGTVVFATVKRISKVLIGYAEMAKLQKEAKERLRIEVEAGNTYYVKWSIGSKMKLMDAATGAKEIQGLNLAKD